MGIFLHTLGPTKGAVRKTKRVGRGQGSGYGGTSTRGHKGAQSRSGYKRRPGFEGGQQPLQRRVPKFGFKNPNRKLIKGLNLDVIAALGDKKGITVITPSVLRDNGLLRKKENVKILGRGTLKGPLSVTAHAFSASAEAQIKKTKGTIKKAE